MKVLTCEDAAEVLKLNSTTVSKLLRSGKLPGQKVGDRWRILETDLEAYLRGEWTPPAPKPAKPTKPARARRKAKKKVGR